MKELGVGLAVTVILVTLRGKPFKVEGILGLFIAGLFCWGLGTLILLPFGK